jgi:hypothetical protein
MPTAASFAHAASSVDPHVQPYAPLSTSERRRIGLRRAQSQRRTLPR